MLTNRVKRVLKKVYKRDERARRGHDGGMPSLTEKIHVTMEDDDTLYYGFLDMGDMDDSEIENALWIRFARYSWHPGALITVGIHWHRQPAMGEGVISFVHRMTTNV